MGAPKKESFAKSHTSPQKGLHSGVFLAFLSLVILLLGLLVFVVIRAILTFCLVPVCQFAVLIICDALGVILRGSHLYPLACRPKNSQPRLRVVPFQRQARNIYVTNFVNPGLTYGRVKVLGRLIVHL